MVTATHQPSRNREDDSATRSIDDTLARRRRSTSFHGCGHENEMDLTGMSGACSSAVPTGDSDRSGNVSIDDFAAYRDAYYWAVPETPYGSGWVSHPDAASGGSDSIVGYCGYIHNHETGEYTVRFRHYAPALGRWLQAEPIGTALILEATRGPSATLRADDELATYLHFSPVDRYFEGSNLLQYVNADPVLLTDAPGLGFVEWLLTGEWDPSPETLDAAKCGYLRGLGMNPFDTTQSMGQLLYTGSPTATHPMLQAAAQAATACASCWKDCMANLNTKLGIGLAAGTGVAVAPVIPKSGVAGMAEAMRWRQLAEGLRNQATWGMSSRTTLARCAQMASGQSRWFAPVSKAFRGIANATKGRGVGKLAVRGGVAIALLEAATGAYCGWKCSE